MKMLIAVGVATITGASAPALAGSNTASRGTGGVATQAEPGAPGSPETAYLDFPARVAQPGQGLAHDVAGAFAAAPRAPVVSEIRVCVAPSGAVSEVKLTRSSGVRAFDKAVVDSASGWIYAAYPAPAGIRVCSIVSVVYRVRRVPPPALARHPTTRR
jgi:TonB family protein